MQYKWTDKLATAFIANLTPVKHIESGLQNNEIKSICVFFVWVNFLYVKPNQPIKKTPANNKKKA